MRKLFKWAFLLALACGFLFGISYAGARTTVGKMLGSPTPPVGNRTITFLWGGAQNLPGKPRVWRFTFSKVAAIGNGRATVYVSPTGKIVRVEPADLESRLTAAAKAKEESI